MFIQNNLVIFKIFFFFGKFTEARTVSWIVFIICCATRNVIAAPVQRHKSNNNPTPSTMDDETATDFDSDDVLLEGIDLCLNLFV